MSQLDFAIDNINKFSSARNWTNLPPEDLAKSICIEAAELLEHFQWSGEKRRVINKTSIALESADIFWYLIRFCIESKIDLAKAINEKIKILEEKYPVKEFANGQNPKFYWSQKVKYRQNKK